MSDTPNDKPQPDALRQQIEAVNAACDEARSDPVSAVRISFGEDAWLDLHADGNGRRFSYPRGPPVNLIRSNAASISLEPAFCASLASRDKADF